jgi:hypothetical protein
MLKRCYPRQSFRLVWAQIHKHTDPSHPLRLLRPRIDRPSECRAAEKSYEFAPSHSPRLTTGRSRAF